MAGVRALRTPRPSLSPRRLRQAGNGIVRPRGDLPDARGAHGRHRRGDDRQRDGSRVTVRTHAGGGALGALRGDLPGAGGRPRHVRRVRQGRRRSGLALWSGGGRRGLGRAHARRLGRPRGPATSPIGAEDLRDDPAFIAWLAKLLRFSATPTAAVAFGRVDETDVRDILPSVGAPTLLMYRGTDDTERAEIEHTARFRSRGRGAAARSLEPVHRRSRPDGRGDRVLPRRCRQLRGFPRSCARDGLLHRHRRLHAAGLRAGGPRLARARRTTSPGDPCPAGALPRR